MRDDSGTAPSVSYNNQQAKSDMDSGQTVKLILFSHEVPSGELQDLLRKLHRYAKTPHYVQLARFLLVSSCAGGLCHVPNVYDAEDISAILDSACVRKTWASRPVQRPLISPYTGDPFSATDAYHLIKAMCAEALTKSLYFDRIAEGIARVVSEESSTRSVVSSCHIFHYRMTQISNTTIDNITKKLSFLNVRQKDLLDWATRDESVSGQLNTKPCLPQNSKLAIIGMACRMPGGANSPQQFSELLMDGKDTHTIVPPDRFDVEAHFDPTGKTENAIGTRFGNFIDNPGFFDAAFFNMSPRETEQTDPMQRLALVTAYEALEMAGFVPGRTPSSHVSRVGTYYGQASDDYREVNAGQRIGTYGTLGTVRAFGNGRINYFFNFQGPSLNVDTACSSGLAAVHEACAALWAGGADMVVAGGLNVITNPDIYCMLTKGHFLSKTGQCKVWDVEADSYCRGDGVGSVVIKRLEDALADNDNILATILSGNTNHSAESASITQPHVGAQIANYRRVMDKAGTSPFDVGDAVESKSVLSFFAPTGRRLRPEQRLYLGGVKSNVGYGEAAAGIASLIKVLLMYRYSIIPRHVGIKTGMNPVVARNLTDRNAGVVFENRPWLPVSPGAKRYSVVNSFGAHGGNTTLLLEDAPSPRSRSNGSPSLRTATSQVICVSAKSKASLRGNVDVLIRYLDAHPETKLTDLAYTTCARRIHHHIRIAFSVTSTTQLWKSLKAATDDLDAHAKHVSLTKQKVIVFAFSGQGSLSQGAAARLFEQAPDFRNQVLQFHRVVRKLGFPSVLAAISGETIISLESDKTSTAEEEAESIIVTQLALVVLQIALTQYWRLLGITPGVVIGHSIGEYAALVTAGRAELMIATCQVGTHAMLSARGASAARIAQICRASDSNYPYEVSCLNGLEDTVLSGKRADMGSLQEMLRRTDVSLRAALLDTLFAFHSAQMEPLLNDFEQAARRVAFKDSSVPIISPLLRQCVSRGGMINETYLRRATREPVDFVTALDAAVRDGVVDTNSAWIDIGPHPVCTSFIRGHLLVASSQTLVSMRRDDDTLATLTKSLAALHCQGYDDKWNEYFAPHETPYRLLELDSYQWNNKNYWIPYEGTWTLDKAHTQRGGTDRRGTITLPFLTSSVQQIGSERFGKSISVVTGSTMADIMFTMGDYLFKHMFPNASTQHINIHNMEVVEAQVLPEEESLSSSQPPAQFILIEGVLDVSQKKTQISLYTAQNGETRRPDRKEFASATVCYEDLQIWQAEWQAASHLVATRAEALWKAATGVGDSSDSNRVSRLARNATYRLFANVVEYGPRYRGMQRVALAEESQEATSDVILDVECHGTWHTPPYWIDSVFQLAGFVMNSLGVVNGDGPGETESCHDFFYITSGWRSLRLAESLKPGPDVVYRNYVRMFALPAEPGVWIGDIYLLREERVVGVCAGIKFKRVPRSLMSVMFPRRKQLAQKPLLQGRSHGKAVAEIDIDGNHTRSQQIPNPFAATHESVQFQAPAPIVIHTSRGNDQADIMHEISSTTVTPVVPVTQEIPPANDGGSNARVASCLRLIAEEIGLDPEDLTGEAAFTDLGIRSEFGIDIQASAFLEHDTVQDFVTWLGK
ncbi:polyketide synthase [Xylaria sp. FL0064]|nr:polyketide synthase [Xylaria sp. FL0064]